MRKRWLVAATALAALAFAVAGCGGSDEEESSTADPVAEISEVRALLGRALAAYKAGNAGSADELVGDAYLEHFEEIEKPLEEQDEELMKGLEVLISTTIRGRIEDGAPAAQVEELVNQAKGQLDEAESLLASG